MAYHFPFGMEIIIESARFLVLQTITLGMLLELAALILGGSVPYLAGLFVPMYLAGKNMNKK